MVLRARPLRGGQPYVLLLQHNGVNSFSAAVQVRQCRRVHEWARSLGPDTMQGTRVMPQRLFSTVARVSLDPSRPEPRLMICSSAL